MIVLHLWIITLRSDAVSVFRPLTMIHMILAGLCVVVHDTFAVWRLGRRNVVRSRPTVIINFADAAVAAAGAAAMLMRLSAVDRILRCISTWARNVRQRFTASLDNRTWLQTLTCIIACCARLGPWISITTNSSLDLEKLRMRGNVLAPKVKALKVETASAKQFQIC